LPFQLSEDSGHLASSQDQQRAVMAG
jgi:hypothetical protein